MVLTTSCEDYLDKSPDLGLTSSEVYSNYESFKGAFDKVFRYNQYFFVSQFNGYIFAAGDEGVTTTIGGPSLWLNNGNWQTGNSLETSFDGRAGADTGGRYNGIAYMTFLNMRTINIALDRIDEVADATEAQKNEIRGQAYFFRAWNYFQLIRRYGGWFKFDQVFNAGDNVDLPRLSYQESTDWLVEDLDKAFELLPDKWPNTDVGRPTKTAAKALKGWALLYAASPTMNPNLGFQYNDDYCKRAAAAAADAINYVNSKGLYRLMPGSTIDEYSQIFYNKTKMASDEAIWYTVSEDGGIPTKSDWNANFIVRSRCSGNVHLATPTQNFVDLFETKDGLPVSDPASGYNDQDPYINREPRFYYNILYHGAPYGYKNGVRQPFELWAENIFDNRISADYQSQPQYFPRVPYLIRKWWPESANVWQDDYKYYMQAIHLRVAQLYLDFAEAANEAYGPNGAVPGTNLTALQAINIIRARVGAVPVPSKFTTSKEIFRERIWNERSVELSFENHRWHDIRRWHTAKELMQDLKKPVITRVGPNPISDITYRYESLPPDLQKVFDDKHYWYPILQSEMDLFDTFEQNPGW